MGVQDPAEADNGTIAVDKHDLSERETEVLQRIALGHTNTEIAGQLDLSVRTVESHRARVQQKLGLSTRAELFRHALDRGLLDLANGAGK
jgi:DNA-binding NarL/FixJ family response regulator